MGFSLEEHQKLARGFLFFLGPPLKYSDDGNIKYYSGYQELGDDKTRIYGITFNKMLAHLTSKTGDTWFGRIFGQSIIEQEAVIHLAYYNPGFYPEDKELSLKLEEIGRAFKGLIQKKLGLKGLEDYMPSNKEIVIRLPRSCRKPTEAFSSILDLWHDVGKAYEMNQDMLGVKPFEGATTKALKENALYKKTILDMRRNTTLEMGKGNGNER